MLRITVSAALRAMTKFAELQREFRTRFGSNLLKDFKKDELLKRLKIRQTLGRMIDLEGTKVHVSPALQIFRSCLMQVLLPSALPSFFATQKISKLTIIKGVPLNLC